MLKRHDFFCWYYVVTNIEALDLTLFEGIGKHLNVVHNDQIAADVQIFQRRILLSDDFTEFSGSLARDLCVWKVAHSDCIGVVQALGDLQSSFVTDLSVVI